jgi:hypothetical protein
MLREGNRFPSLSASSLVGIFESVLNGTSALESFSRLPTTVPSGCLEKFKKICKKIFLLYPYGLTGIL